MSDNATFDEQAIAGMRRRLARKAAGRARISRGVTLLTEEDRMLAALMEYGQPLEHDRSATVGMLVRLAYDLLTESGQLAADPEIPPEAYSGWRNLWRLGKNV